MKEIGNFIGGMITLFFIGAITYGIFKEGHTDGIIFIITIVVIFFIWVIRENNKLQEEKRKQEITDNAEQDEKLRIALIEKMTEAEFISFVKYNHDNLDKHFKNGRLTQLGQW